MNILTDKPKRTAGNAWLERVNPLHGLTISQARNIFDVARAHGSPLLQKIYDEIELVDPVLGVCVDRRQAALAELGWKISPRPSADQVLADEQKDALDQFVRGIGNFTETVEYLDLAFFRGFSVVQPIWEGDEVRHVSLLESWNFLFDDDKRLLWNPDCSLDPRACFEIPAAARIVQVRRRRPIDYPALAIHIRKYLGERDWGRFIERYGIPPVDVVMAPNATNENKADYVEAADRARDGLSTVWPSGSSTSRAEGSRGQDPFSAFIEHQEKLIVLRATGGTLTSLAQADTGSLAGGAQMEVWDQIVQRDSSLISDALNRQMFWRFLERKFPGRLPAVEFSIGREREVTASDAADLAVKLHGAGYLVDQAELEEATGFTLEKAPETPPQGGLGGLSLNKKPQTPLQNDENRLQNAPRVSDGQGDPQGENALVEALSGLFEKSLAEAAAEAVEGEDPSPSSRPSQESLKSLAEVANKNEQPRGKTSPKSTPGSFASADDASGAPAGKPKEDKGQQISQERAAILSGKLRVISPSEAHVLLSEPVTVKNPTGAEFRFTKEKLLSDNSHLKKDHSNADFHRREKVMLYAIDAAKTSRDITNSRSSQPNEHGVYVQRKEVRKKYTDPKTKKQFEVVVRADNNGEVYEAFDVFPR